MVLGSGTFLFFYEIALAYVKEINPIYSWVQVVNKKSLEKKVTLSNNASNKRENK